MSLTEIPPAAYERTHDPVDLSSKDFWNLRLEKQLPLYAELRRDRPVSWQRPIEDAVVPDPDDPGYWAVTRYEDIVHVSKNHEVFVSGEGVLFDLLPPMFLEMTQSFLAMDPPQHHHLRRLISSAFTPRQVARIDDLIRERATEIVDAIAGKGEIDFVHECSRRLPLEVYCQMFGVPEGKWDELGEAADGIVAWADEEALAGRDGSEVQIESALWLHECAEEMADERRENPDAYDDLMMALVNAEVDGEKLDNFQIGAFFVLMSVAATDTTKHTTSLALLEFTNNPEQRQWLLEDLDGRWDQAVEEMLRHTSSVMTFRRTCVQETELGGETILPGDKVVMFYPSGNYDDAVRDHPEKFDLSRPRETNKHCTFGGGGAHFCLGSNLAKVQLKYLWKELLTRLPDIEGSDPAYLGTNFMRGIKRMKATFTPES